MRSAYRVFAIAQNGLDQRSKPTDECIPAHEQNFIDESSCGEAFRLLAKVCQPLLAEWRLR